MATERHETIISVQFLESGDAAKIAADMRKIGAVSEEQARKLSSMGSATNFAELARELQLSTRGFVAYDQAVNRALRSTSATTKEVGKLSEALGRLQGLMKSGGDLGAIRRAAFDTLRQNQVNLGIADQGRQAFAQSRLGATPPAQALPQYRAEQIKNPMAELGRVVAQMERVARVAAVQPALPLSSAGGAPEPSRQRALPPGTGTSSSPAEIQRQQQDYVRSLRERAETNRQLAREDRIAGIASRSGARLGFGPGGNTEISFEQRSVSGQMAELSGTLTRLNREYEAALASMKLSAQKVNVATAEANAAKLMEWERTKPDGHKSYFAGDVPLQAAHAGFDVANNPRTKRPPDYIWRLLTKGAVNYEMANKLGEEDLVALTGGSMADWKARGAFKGHGTVPVPGLMHSDEMRRQLTDQHLDPLPTEIGKAEKKLAALQQNLPQLEVRSKSNVQRDSAAAAAEVQRQVQLQKIVNDLIQREVAAQQRIAASRALLAKEQAAQSALLRPPTTHSDENAYQIPANRLGPRPPAPEPSLPRTPPTTSSAGAGALPPVPPPTAVGGYSNGPGGGGLNDIGRELRAMLQGLLHDEGIPGSKRDQAQAKLFQAQEHALDVLAKSQKDIGGDDGGYQSESARDRAVAGAYDKLVGASRNLTAATEAAAKAHQKLTAEANAQAAQTRITPQFEAQVDAAMAARAAGQPTAVNKAENAVLNAQGRVNSAQLDLEKARSKVYADETAATIGLTTAKTKARTAQQALDEATVKLAEARRKAAQQTATTAGSAGGAGGAGSGGGTILGGAGSGGGGGGLFSQFQAGFKGRGEMSYAEQLGQTFKFSVFYGTAYKLLFALTQTLQASLQEGIAFQDSMTALTIASGRPKKELDGIAQQLASSSVQAGFSPSQGVEIGARSLGLYGATGSEQAIQDEVMRTSSRVVSRLAVGSKKDPVALQGDIAAIAQALGLGSEGQQRIADLDAFMTKKFGVQQGSTLETVAQSASVGKAAGFSDEQLFAIAADMISRTGQTPSAVAGFMAQIFSRGGEGSLVDVAKKQGIDPNQELSGIVKQLADLYKTAAPREQAQISAAFGRGKIQNAAVALLGDYNEVQKQSAASNGAKGAAGAADQQFNEHMKNIGGQIAQLGGELKNTAQLLGESGLLDVIGAGVVVLKEFFKAVNGILGLWNQLGNTTQDLILGFAALYAAQKAGLIGQGIGALAARRGVLTGAGGIGQGALMAAAGAGPTFATGAKAAGGALLGMVGPVGLAIGGLLAVGELYASSKRMKEAQEAASGAIASFTPTKTTTASDYRAQAANLKSLAGQNRDATGWFTNLVSFGQANNSSMDTAKRLEAEAKRLNGIAGRIDAQASATPKAEPNVFQSLGADDISQGLQSITDTGGTAAQQLAALRDVLYGTADAASKAAEVFKPGDFAAKTSTGVASSAIKGLKGVSLSQMVSQMINGPHQAPTPFYKKFQGADFQDELSAVLTGGEAQKRIEAGLAQLKVKKLGDLNSGTSGQLAAIVGAGVAKKVLEGSGADPKTIAKFQAAIDKSIKAYLLSQSKDAVKAADPNSKLTAADATALAQNLVNTSATRSGELQGSDLKGKVNVAKKLVRDLHQVQRRADAPVAYVSQQLAVARRAVAQAQFDEFEALRRVAMQNAKSGKAASAVGHRMLVAEVNKAINAGNADLLVTIIQQAGMGARAIVKKSIDDARKVAQAALREAQAMLSAVAGIGVLLDPLAQFEPNVLGFQSPEQKAQGKKARAAYAAAQKAQSQLKDIRKLDQALNYTPSASPDNNVYSGKGSDVYSPNYGNGKGGGGAGDLAADKETAAEREAARASAYATRSEGSMAAAKASIASAKAAMAKATKNSVEYWNAMGSLFEAQNSLADASLAYHNNLRLLNIDLTNPAQEARVAATTARLKLQRDRRTGKAPDVRAQDRVDYRRAQAEAEATRFSQRLQTVQTAEELGRISHGRYINYLDNERRRLERIKHKTFQQKDQLNQIDRALKAASDQMQGQWNFGDIKIPKPYQVRRYIAQQNGAREARLAASHSTAVHNTHISINGTDVGWVKKLIQQYLGHGGKTRTTQSRRR